MRRNEDCSSKSQISDRDVKLRKHNAATKWLNGSEVGAPTNRSCVGPEEGENVKASQRRNKAEIDIFVSRS